tara:strand:+ start:379 stop:675 length:297 start_codon:yes stop_codon:yes gene_type:complete
MSITNENKNMTALENFLKQIVLKQVQGSVYLLPAICDFQIEEALEEERIQRETLHINSNTNQKKILYNFLRMLSDDGILSSDNTHDDIIKKFNAKYNG